MLFDLIVIGGGSGGIACARSKFTEKLLVNWYVKFLRIILQFLGAATYGAKVCVIEGKAFGGTCVNVGCVPKKIMFNAAHISEIIREAHHFGFEVPENEIKFDWNAMKKSRDTYISRLNGIYEGNLDNSKITRINGFASFNGPETVVVNDQVLKSKHIVIAVGGAPNKLGIVGEELAMDSDGFFALEEQPKKVAILGAGYIAVELAGVFNGLGTKTSLFVRKNQALRNFDAMLRDYLDESMKRAGIDVIGGSVINQIYKSEDQKLNLIFENDQKYFGFDAVIAATGRHPTIDNLNLSSVNVATDENGYIKVNEFQNTSSTGIYAIGDVVGNIELTPMAIAAGRRLSDRLFGGLPKARADYSMVPTVVFSHPTIGTIGVTEEEAYEKYGCENIKLYTSTFVNLWYATFYNGKAGPKPFCKYKLVTLLPNETVIGLHAIGLGSDEVIQGFAVAMKMGATKADFDNAIGKLL